MIDDFLVSASDIEIESVRGLALDVPEAGLAVSSCLHDVTHCVSSEEGMELGHSTVQGLGCRSAAQLHLQILRRPVTRVFDEHLEPLALEGSVLD